MQARAKKLLTVEETRRAGVSVAEARWVSTNQCFTGASWINESNWSARDRHHGLISKPPGYAC